jgi:hypothetical protein
MDDDVDGLRVDTGLELETAAFDVEGRRERRIVLVVLFVLPELLTLWRGAILDVVDVLLAREVNDALGVNPLCGEGDADIKLDRVASSVPSSSSSCSGSTTRGTGTGISILLSVSSSCVSLESGRSPRFEPIRSFVVAVVAVEIVDLNDLTLEAPEVTLFCEGRFFDSVETRIDDFEEAVGDKARVGDDLPIVRAVALGEWSRDRDTPERMDTLSSSRDRTEMPDRMDIRSLSSLWLWPFVTFKLARDVEGVGVRVDGVAVGLERRSSVGI